MDLVQVQILSIRPKLSSDVLKSFFVQSQSVPAFDLGSSITGNPRLSDSKIQGKSVVIREWKCPTIDFFGSDTQNS